MAGAKPAAPKKRLTEMSHCAGCAAKLKAGDLATVLGGLKGAASHPRALVGFNTNDDAAVYQVAPGMAVVETVDFFPPLVDDPFQFGAIAAANALSDIWAMGAKPLFALNLVCFPDELPLKTLQKILAGGQSKADEAGIPILGGHSIRDPEPKFGMAVTGVVHPKKVLTNAGAKPGDVLLLTKPVGTGIAATAIKRGLASKQLTRRVTAQMATLNKAAGEVFASGAFKVHALTDVTGFGLLGHLLEMMNGAKTRAAIDLERIPLIAEVPALAEAGVIPGGTKTNLAHVKKQVTFPEGLPEHIQWLLADAQTNGGLLASVPARHALKAIQALEKAGVDAALIGEVQAGRPGIDVIG
ncbi:selenide, water dikinase SelD [Corallococcus sp. AB049A]|uniref:Selenide, water dikinase n=1 Tax=Corallococcus interemptor TaxID=2316720 RepID=A0A3A8QD00_9BACT|nr:MULTISPECIES: selenide, water dikinase SelD [Corallococcus]RKH65998.1 selenide, water dikinase SelD [Corallococcus interemptor]RKI67571.1 selenide, water dikinase SelD [Corallococcus sp. AB049A]